MKHRILLVEDSPTQAMRAKDLLEEAGFAVEVAENGKIGLEKATSSIPDLIITDILMPVMNGYEMTQALKADPLTAGLPILLLTGQDQPQDIIRGLEVGADHFVTKPYDDGYLLGRLEGLFASLEKARLGHLMEQQQLQHFTREVGVTLSRKKILKSLLLAISHVTHCQALGLYLHKPGEGRFMFIVSNSLLDRGIGERIETEMDKIADRLQFEAPGSKPLQTFAVVAETDEPVAEDPQTLTNSSFFVPLLVEGQPASLLSIFSEKEEAFDLTHLRFLFDMGQLAVESLSHVRLGDETELRLSSVKVMVIEDSPTQAAQVRIILEAVGYEVVVATTGNQGIKMAKESPPDVVILDVVLPDIDGYTVCRRLRQQHAAHIPILMLTERQAVEDMVDGLEVGADDYLAKPFEELVFLARIKALVRIKRLQDELQRRLEEEQHSHWLMKQLAISDFLTSLFNRYYFMDMLEREFSLAQRYHTPLSCILVDIDHFKKVNDSYGHSFGDDVLKGVAETLQKNVRRPDIVARYGGEEFSILLPMCDAEGAFILAERLRRLVESLRWEHESGQVQVTISIGVADFSEDHVLTRPEDLLSYADQAIYQAKEDGRNRVLIFDPASWKEGKDGKGG